MKDFDRFFVGFEPIVKRMTAEQTVKTAQNYPPYNIKKIDENKYIIELAIAGFCKQDIEIELTDDKLIIKGNMRPGEPAEQDTNGNMTWPHILYHGLATRSFTRTFNIADNIEIRGASMLNGILKIVLEAIIPEHKKSKKIVITDEETSTVSSSAEYLAERKEK
jgi:molecular chaperone IbpA